jgi:hypothetical protein
VPFVAETTAAATEGVIIVEDCKDVECVDDGTDDDIEDGESDEDGTEDKIEDDERDVDSTEDDIEDGEKEADVSRVILVEERRSLVVVGDTETVLDVDCFVPSEDTCSSVVCD